MFGLEGFDRRVLVENVKERVVKRRYLIIDVLENTGSVPGGQILETTSHNGERNRFWTHQS